MGSVLRDTEGMIGRTLWNRRIYPRSGISPILGVLLLVNILLSPFTLAFGPPRLVESDQGTTPVYNYQLRALKNMKMPILTAAAVLVMDDTTGRVVYQRNANQRRAMASTTKMMTAVLALENGKLADKIVVKAKDLVGESTMSLQAGDVVTLEDLLYGLLLPSGNDAAEVIADYIGGGSVPHFVDMMNQKAKELGLKDTQYKNPHGLDEDGHYSSAYDLAVLGRYAMRNPTFAKIVGTNTAVRVASRTFQMINSNQFLRRPDLLSGVDGIKTGTTGNAGDCLILSMNVPNHRLISVVLGAESRVNDTVELMNFISANYDWYPTKQPLIGRFQDDSGNTHSIGLAEKRTDLLPKWEQYYDSYSLRIDKGTDPYSVGTLVGSAFIRIGADGKTEIPLAINSN